MPETSRSPASVNGGLEFALEKLRQKNVSPEFLQLLQKEYRENERSRVLDLNILGFLKVKPAEQDESIPVWELERVKKFLRKNRRTFTEVEKQFAVPKEVIASLLWVETKHGRDMGTFHVGSAFLSIAQADYREITAELFRVAKERASPFTLEIQQRIEDRCRTKAQWAVDELVALEELHRKKYKNAAKLNGSFSGAFGMAQFLPSSYLSWAKGRKKQPNLFKADDSIYSVANYLTINGWQKQSRQAQEAALFHYNRDRNYVNRILRMSDCLKHKKKKPKRNVASARSC